MTNEMAALVADGPRARDAKLCLGFLGSVGCPPMSMVVAWPVMSVLWALSQIAVQAK
jgi:hypothetical protein